jgi:hypothetical protein
MILNVDAFRNAASEGLKSHPNECIIEVNSTPDQHGYKFTFSPLTVEGRQVASVQMPPHPMLGVGSLTSQGLLLGAISLEYGTIVCKEIDKLISSDNVKHLTSHQVQIALQALDNPTTYSNAKTYTDSLIIIKNELKQQFAENYIALRNNKNLITNSPPLMASAQRLMKVFQPQGMREQ